MVITFNKDENNLRRNLKIIENKLNDLKQKENQNKKFYFYKSIDNESQKRNNKINNMFHILKIIK